jgi:hypothetical protein
MGKTVAISDDIHTLVSKKKTELFEKYKISVRIADLVNKSIKHGIDKAYEEFVPQGEVQKLELIKKEDMT